MKRETANMLEEYSALVAREKQGVLSPEGAQRLELLRDVLLELGALATEGGSSQQARPVRADAVLEVSFSARDEVVRAYSKNIGIGGIALRTPRALPVGSTTELRIKLPDGGVLVAHGRVAWAEAEAAGIEFTHLGPNDDRRLKELLVEDASVLRKIRSVLTKDVRDLRSSAPSPVDAAEVDMRPLVLVRTADPKWTQLTVEVLRGAGLRAEATGTQAQPSIVVADSTGVLETSVPPGARLVLLNVSGPDALVGRLAQLRPAVFVRRGAPMAELVRAVSELLREV